MNSKLIKQCVAEFVGTFALIFVGVGAIYHLGAIDENGGLLGIALAHGLTIAVMVSATGAISGGHLNPAVTFGLLVGGQMDLPRSIAYWLSYGGGCFVCFFFFGFFRAGGAGPPAGRASGLSGGVARGGFLYFFFVFFFFWVFLVLGWGVVPRGLVGFWGVFFCGGFFFFFFFGVPVASGPTFSPPVRLGPVCAPPVFFFWLSFFWGGVGRGCFLGGSFSRRALQGHGSSPQSV